MATFGSFPGVQVTTVGGGISGVQVGAEEKLVVFGEADTANGSASANEPTEVGSRQDAEAKFGDSELAQGLKDALGNGANVDYLYGVALATTAVSGEAFSGTASGTLANAPIVEDLSTISVQDTVDIVACDVEFRYESPPEAPSTVDTVFINPLTGEWTADSSSDYEFDYEYQEWDTALDSSDAVVNEGETGVYATLSDSESVASSLSGKVTSLRSEYQFVYGVSGAEPNAEDADNDPHYDTSTYTDSIDNDSMYLVAPARRDDSQYTIVGGVAGLFAGAGIEEPVYNDALNGFTELEQKLSRSEAGDLRDVQVIPVRQGGSIRVKSNSSTSTEVDWERDFWRRRIVDRVILLSKQVGDGILGRINDEDTRDRAENLLFAEFDALVDQRLLQPNTADETNWYVDVYEDANNADEVNIDIGITPQGIVKRVDETITINT